MGLFDNVDDRQLGLLTAGLAMLAARGVSPIQALGQAGLLGVSAMDENRQSRRRDELAGAENDWKRLQMEQTKKKWAADEAAAAAAAQFGQRVSGALSGAPQLQNIAPGGPTPANAASVAPKSKIEQYRAAAELFVGAGRTEDAKRLFDMADKLEEQFSQTPQTFMRDGQPISAVLGNRGTVKPLNGYAPPPQTELVNLGGTMQAVDKLRTQPGATFTRTVSPDTVYGGNITIRGQNMTDARSREANVLAAAGKVGEAVASLRKEFNGLDEVKNFKAAAPMIESARNAPDTPAGDLDLIYAVGKILDPGSVVREGELQLVIKSGTPLERFAGYTRAIAQGKGRLPPGQRVALVKMLEGRVGELGAAYQMSRAAYEKSADAMGLPKEQIFTDVAQTSGKLTAAEQAELDALRKRFGR